MSLDHFFHCERELRRADRSEGGTFVDLERHLVFKIVCLASSLLWSLIANASGAAVVSHEGKLESSATLS